MGCYGGELSGRRLIDKRDLLKQAGDADEIWGLCVARRFASTDYTGNLVASSSSGGSSSSSSSSSSSLPECSRESCRPAMSRDLPSLCVRHVIPFVK